jgi:hypothetical protein
MKTNVSFVSGLLARGFSQNDVLSILDAHCQSKPHASKSAPVVKTTTKTSGVRRATQKSLPNGEIQQELYTGPALTVDQRMVFDYLVSIAKDNKRDSLHTCQIRLSELPWAAIGSVYVRLHALRANGLIEWDAKVGGYGDIRILRSI